MTLNSRAKVVPGGWIYTQAGTNFNIRSMGGFNDALAELVAHRVANRLERSSPVEAAADLDEAQCVRLGNDPAWCSDLKKNSPRPTFRAAASKVREAAQAAVAKAIKLGAGVANLSDWRRRGFEPVPAEVAQPRADVCTGRISGRPCPSNKNGLKITEAIAASIKSNMEEKQKSDFQVAGEENLKTCATCLCFLPLKIWEPMDIILEHITEKELTEFKEANLDCWVRK